MTELKKVVDLFTGTGALGAVCGAVVLLALGGAGWWVRHRRNERRHEEEMCRLGQEDRRLAMIERAAFDDREAVEALARLLSTSSPPDHPARPSLTDAGDGQGGDPGWARFSSSIS